MKVQIDVIIPSFRLEEKYILPILNLARPTGADIKFYLLSDNPSIDPPPDVLNLVNDHNVFLLVNEVNSGAAVTRNRGIDAGSGDWILFLDDDIIVRRDLLQVYATAAAAQPDAIGFIGLTEFPAPSTSFTRAIRASGSMDIFTIAAKKPDFAWGATVNSMVSRKATADIRFSTVYPKAGGGEDIDFFLRVRQRNDYKNYKTLPEAAVQHPWWKNEQPDFGRPFRYGLGNSWLVQQIPVHAYRDLLNTPETLLLLLLLLPFVLLAAPAWIVPLFWIIAGVMATELIANAIQTLKRQPQSGAAVIFYVTCLRMVYETGVLTGKLSRGYFKGIGLRFHDNGLVNKNRLFRLNTYKTAKWLLYLALAVCMLVVYG